MLFFISSFFINVTDHLSTLLRSLVLNLLIKFGGKDFLKVAKKKFEDHCAGDSTIPADLRTVVYKAVISVNGKKAFNSLLNVISRKSIFTLVSKYDSI